MVDTIQLALHSTTLIIWECKMDRTNLGLNLNITAEFYIKKLIKKKNHEKKQYNILVLALVGKQMSLANLI